MSKENPNFIKKEFDDVIAGLIVLRLDREPFFGIQTVFAPL